MEERRQHPRRPVSWPVRLRLGIDLYGLARVVDASARGLRLAASEALRTSLKVGEPYRIEIDGGPDVEVVYVGEVRNLGKSGIGIELQQELSLAGAETGGADETDADTLERSRSEAVLENIVAGVSAATGEAFFRSLVQHLTRMLDVNYAFVGELVEETEKVATIAACDEGRIVKNFEYGLLPGRAGPAEADDVGELFPFSDVLSDVNVGYMGAPLYDSAQRLLGLLAVTNDAPVTDRKLADAILRIFAVRAAAELERARSEQERNRLSSAVEQAAESIMITKLDGTIVYVNPAFERATGYAAPDVLGNTPDVLRSDKHDGAFYADLWHTLRAGRVWHGEIVNRRKDGSLFTEELNISPVRDEQGRITNYVSIAQDVTARRELEAQLRQAQKMEAVGRLAGGVAHDFNNLLTIVKGRSQILLARPDLSDSVRRNVDLIEKAADRASGLTKQLLAFSRKQVLELKVLDLNAIVSGLEPMLRRLIGEHIELTLALDPDCGHVKADPGQLEQVIMNLIVNARDAMPQGGRLTIETLQVALAEGAATQQHPDARPGTYAVLTVSDTGTGMDADTKARIFEPFFTTKELGKGTGLGLSTVYGIVQQSGGFITVESEPGRGTAFSVCLPWVADPVGTGDTPAPAPRRIRGTETILLVEDQEEVLELASEILQAEGYAVLVARQGDEALRLYEQHTGPIHLLVTDVVMPQMSGRELAERFARVRPKLKVLYMSGYTDDEVVNHGDFGSAAALLQKPFSPDALVKKVREMLDAPVGT
jgi:PAS domain S-box-containing protein